MFCKTKIAFCVALILGSASAALASNENVSDQSVSEAQARRDMNGDPLPWWWNIPSQSRGSFAQAHNTFDYVALPIQQGVPSRKKSHKH